jgi:hypothetical protein
MTSHRALVLILALGAVACASARPASEEARKGAPARQLPNRYLDADGVEVTCHMEMPSGSHIAERVCHRASPSADQQRQIDDLLRRSQPQNRPGGG